MIELTSIDLSGAPENPSVFWMEPYGCERLHHLTGFPAAQFFLVRRFLTRTDAEIIARGAAASGMDFVSLARAYISLRRAVPTLDLGDGE